MQTQAPEYYSRYVVEDSEALRQYLGEGHGFALRPLRFYVGLVRVYLNQYNDCALGSGRTDVWLDEQ